MSEEKKTLLIVEDDIGIQRQLRWALDEYNVVFATDRATALAQFRAELPPVVTLDLGLPPDADGSSEGFAVLEEILTLSPETKVVIVTGQDTREHAMKAVAQGAYDFYTKPIDPGELGLILRRAFYLSELEDENRRLIQSRRHMPLKGVITVTLSTPLL